MVSSSFQKPKESLLQPPIHLKEPPPQPTAAQHPSYLIRQDGKSPLKASSRPVLGRPGEPLGVVTNLGFQGVDLGDDLLGSDDVLWDVDDGLAAGRCTKKDEKRSKGSS